MRISECQQEGLSIESRRLPRFGALALRAGALRALRKQKIIISGLRVQRLGTFFTAVVLSFAIPLS